MQNAYIIKLDKHGFTKDDENTQENVRRFR